MIIKYNIFIFFIIHCIDEVLLKDTPPEIALDRAAGRVNAMLEAL